VKHKWIKIIFFVAAYGFLFYKISSFNFNNIKSLINWYSITALLLMPLNWYLEIIKWQALTKITCCKLIFHKAYKSVIYGLIASIPTPNRVGDYYGRTWITTDKNKKNQLFITSLLSSFLQTSITFIAGIISYFWLAKTINIPYYIIAISTLIIFFTIILILKIKKKYFIQITNNISKNFHYQNLVAIILLAIFRYIIFIVQAYLLFLATGIHTTFTQTFNGLSLIYFITLFIPSFFWAELGIRGSLASIIFPMVGINEKASIIVISILWLINIGLPVIIGSLFLNKKEER